MQQKETPKKSSSAVWNMIRGVGIAGAFGLVLALLLTGRASQSNQTAAQSASSLQNPPAGINQPGARPRAGFDPLSQGEQARARDATLRDPRVARHLQSARRSEVLLVQRRQESKDAALQGAPRRADVLIYLYDQDILIKAITDVGAGTVQRVDAVQRVQPLITRGEAARALTIALADSQAGPLIRAEYQSITGTPLTAANQLEVTAGVFDTASLPDLANARDCGLHRCAYLLLGVPDSYALNATVIVDLSAERVAHAGP